MIKDKPLHNQHVRDYHANSSKLYGEDRTVCEVWSRVMGYMRPVDYWNVGKKQEHKDRVFFKEDKINDISE